MSSYTGFTRLCKGIAVVLVGGHIVVQILPSAVSYLALVPAKTIPFGWNLVTAGYIEQSIYGMVTSTIGLLVMGKLLEPIWGPREFLKFIFVVNFLTSLCVFITAVSLYYITTQESYLLLNEVSPIIRVYRRMKYLLYIGFSMKYPNSRFPFTSGFLKFIFVVNFLTSLCVFITAVSLYYITTQESYLYMPISGFQGVLCGFLVGVKQIIPDQELSMLKIKAKWLPSLALLVFIVVSFFTTESALYLPTVIFGTYIGWIYLRYWQSKSETKLRGDPSDEFAFSSFFPEFLRPVIDPVATIFERILCGKRSDTSDEARGYTLGATSLPGSDPIEASRRRERGNRALEERLAERLAAAAGRTEETKKDATENV